MTPTSAVPSTPGARPWAAATQTEAAGPATALAPATWQTQRTRCTPEGRVAAALLCAHIRNSDAHPVVAAHPRGRRAAQVAAAQLRWPPRTFRGRRAPSVADAHLATPRRAGHVDVAHRASCATSTQGARRRRQVIHRSMTRHPSTPTSTTCHQRHPPPRPPRLRRTSPRPASRDG
jgi:hypothetical protein